MSRATVAIATGPVSSSNENTVHATGMNAFVRKFRSWNSPAQRPSRATGRQDRRLEVGAIGRHEIVGRARGARRSARVDTEQPAAGLVEVGCISVRVADADEVVARFDQTYEAFARFVGAALIVDVDVHADPTDDRSVRVPLRKRAHELPPVRAVRREHLKLRLVGFTARERSLPARAGALALVGMDRLQPGVA